MYGCAFKQCIFCSCNKTTFTAMRFGENPFTCRCEKEKGLRLSNSILLMVVFKRHHSSEGVKGDSEKNYKLAGRQRKCANIFIQLLCLVVLSLLLQ